MSGPKWTDADDKFIRDYWHVMTDEQLAAFLCRPLASLIKRREDLRLLRKVPVTTGEHRVVRDNPELRSIDHDGIGRWRVEYIRRQAIRFAP